MILKFLFFRYERYINNNGSLSHTPETEDETEDEIEIETETEDETEISLFATETKPIIVIDFKSLVYHLARRSDDAIYGGRHQMILQSWKEILDNFVSTGCKLVFFSDWILTKSKKETWIERENQEFERCVKFYAAIDQGKTIPQIVAEINDKEKEMLELKPPNSMFYDMEIIAKKYGEFHYSVNQENDLELAQYATKKDAFAVISNDSDFLIFDGRWNHFSPKNITGNSLRVFKRDRNGLRNRLHLTRKDMPLFATVLGNDFFPEKLFECIEDAANFARNKSSLSTDQIIEELSKQNINVNHVIAFQNSLDAYKFDENPVDDPHEKKLQENEMYRFHKVLMSPIHAVSPPFYDMKENAPKINLPELIIRWTRRKVGILHEHKHRNGDSHTFSVVAKKTFDEPISRFGSTPDYPNYKDCKSMLLF